MRLAELQQRLQAAILDPTATAPELGFAPERMRIHHHHFWSRMRKFVRFRHPLLAQLLGKDELARVVETFITRHPPSTAIASQVPARLSQFLATEPPWCATPVLSALANYDWHRAIVAASAEEIPITRAELDALPGEVRARVAFRLKKRAILLDTPYRFGEMRAVPWQAPPEERQTCLLIEAEGQAFHVRELGRREFHALSFLAGALSLWELFPRLAAHGIDPSHTTKLLGDWLDRGLLVPVPRAPPGQRRRATSSS